MSNFLMSTRVPHFVFVLKWVHYDIKNYFSKFQGVGGGVAGESPDAVTLKIAHKSI